MRRSTEEEKRCKINALEGFGKVNEDRCTHELEHRRNEALAGENIFASLMEAVKSCSLGQISKMLYEVGGQYRRHM